MPSPSKKLLFILSGNLSTTPRAIKNIKLALQSYSVDVVKVNRQSGWNKLDKELAEQLNIIPVSVNLGRKPLLPWLKANLIFYISRLFVKLNKESLKHTAYASQKVAIQITQILKKIPPQYDLIIGQGGGTIFPVYHYAKKHNIPFGLDIEDYHPGETQSPQQQKQIESILRTILPEAAYITYASPLIGQHILNLLPSSSAEAQRRRTPKKHFLINNSFPSSEFSLPTPSAVASAKAGLHLIWFSQNIAPNRGLEQFITALKTLNETQNHINEASKQPTIHLTLIGNIYPSFATNWLLPNTSFISHLPPMSQSELHKVLSDFDIGLALEPGKDLNNSIALSNKIFAYAQAGLYILATNTPAQKQFVDEHPWSGMITGQSPEEMALALQEIIEKKEQIRAGAMERFEKARDLACEHEAGKLVETWEEIIG